MKRLLKGYLLFLLTITSFAVRAQVDFLFSDALKPGRFSTSVDLSDSLPRVKAFVNGKEEIFVLDNGCSYFLINTDYWKHKMIADSNIIARGVGGVVQAGAVFVDSFYWQGIAKNQFKAVAAALPHLGDSICGLMGYDVYKDYEMTIDYQQQLVSFVSNDSVFYDPNEMDSLVIVPFTMSRHLPVVDIRIGKDTLKMAIDCASSQNLMYSKFIPRMKQIKRLSRTMLRGAGTKLLPVQQGIIPKSFVDTVGFKDMKFTFDDVAMEHVNESLETKIDGLLGYPFLIQYKMSINFREQQLRIFTRNEAN